MLIRLIWTWLWEHFQLNKTRQVVAVYCNTVACSCNDCCYENAAKHFLCIVDLHVAVNNMKLLTVTMEIQEWAPFALLLIYEIFPTAVNNTYEVTSSCETPDVSVWFQPHLEILDQSSSKSLTSNLMKNLSSGKFTDTCGWMDIMKQIYTFCCLCKKPQSPSHLA